MAILIFRLSLVFSLCLLTHARVVRFRSAVSHASNSEGFTGESSLLPSAKPDYPYSVGISKPAASISLESDAVRDTQRSDAVAAVPLRRPEARSFDLSLRPMNPRLHPFPLTDRRPLRPRRHRCYHRHPISIPHVRVPYGDDMIVGGSGIREGLRGDLGTIREGQVFRGPEGERVGGESRLRGWFWNIINGF